MSTDNMNDSLTGSLGLDSTLTIVDFDNYSVDASDVGIFTDLNLSTATITSGPDFRPNVAIDNHGINMSGDTDIFIGSTSLKEFMARVEERLNILQPNPGLEQEWNQLKDLGDQYRKLEAEILEKQKIWKSLKQ